MVSSCSPFASDNQVGDSGSHAHKDCRQTQSDRAGPIAHFSQIDIARRELTRIDESEEVKRRVVVQARCAATQVIGGRLKCALAR